MKNGIVSIFSLNAVNIVIGIFIAFILPKELSYEAYADIKLYQLFVSFGGILHFGYVDAVYLKYGGKKLSSINEIAKELNTLIVFQSAVTFLVLLSSCILKSTELIFFALTLLPINLLSFFQMFYQAVGEFSAYCKSKKWFIFFNLFFNLIFVYIIPFKDSLTYMIGYVFIYWLNFIIVFSTFKKVYSYKQKEKCFSKASLKNNIKNGINLLLGNFISLMLTSIDRWFVKIFLNYIVFAQYSFAANIENFIDNLTAPLAITLYNFFCTNRNNEDKNRIKSYINIMSAYVMTIMFVIIWIINRYIPTYQDSVSIIIYLFSAQMFIIPVKCIYVNEYKAQKMQVKYFKKTIYILFVGIFLNICGIVAVHSPDALAVATLGSSIVWLCLSCRDFPQIGFLVKDYFFVFFNMSLLIYLGNFADALTGGMIYLLFITLLTALVYYSELINLGRAFKERREN